MTEFLKFVLERHAMYTRRMSGQTPLTLDPHLRDWRYCNMYRELDTVTAEIRTRWREPNEADPNLFLAMAIARFVNLPEALWDVGYPHAWDPTAYKAKMAARQAAGLNVEGGAYMIPSIGDYPEGTSKFVGHADLLFTPMWAARERLRPHEGDTLATFHARLCEFDGVGDFLGGQIVADVKYVKPLLDAADWWTVLVQ